MIYAETADWHLGYRKYANPALQEEFFEAANDMLEKAKKEGADFVTVAGDILHSNRSVSTHAMSLRRLNQKAKDLGLTVLTIPGNHDYTEPHWTATIESRHLEDGCTVEIGNPDNFGIFCISGRTVTLKKSESDTMVVHGCPVRGKQALSEYDFPACDIFVYHGPVREFFSFGDRDSIPAISDFKWDKIRRIAALGDIHKKGKVAVPGTGQLIGYPGSTNATQKSEEFDKSFYLYDFEKGESRTVPVEIKRKTIRRSVFNDEDFSKLLAELKAGEKFLLYMIYPGEEYTLVQRLRQSVDPNKVITILEPVYRPKIDKGSGQEDVDAEEFIREANNLTFDDVLKSLSGGSESSSYQLVSQLVVQDQDPSSVLDQWVEKRMGELGLDAAELREPETAS